jgi:ketosteroid isomerase-like protein
MAAGLRAQTAPGADQAAIRQLNNDYIRAFLASDVGRFRTILADDFTGVLADGRAIDKAAFLLLARSVPDARDLRLHDLSIRQYGDSALVTALVTYAKADGSAVRTRYSSVFVRKGPGWVVEWTQWTRVAGP